MARIPDELLARLKREVSLLDRVRSAGIVLKRQGANWLGRCPFHDDHGPSLVVTPAKNLWHCLGGVPGGWERDRLGDALGERVVSRGRGATAAARPRQSARSA